MLHTDFKLKKKKKGKKKKKKHPQKYDTRVRRVARNSPECASLKKLEKESLF